MCGKVILVGAGPGDPGLLTLKGRQALESAQVVVYDRLVSPAVLQMIPEAARRINVGKEMAHHPTPQEEINRILLEQAQQGNVVVRLKGGDPFLFGRGGEELELLREHGIPFEVVPGVTSALAAPAYGGIPVTHRSYSSSLHIITGHAQAGKALEIDFEALVRTGGTLVFMMGVAALPQICSGLLRAGSAPDTPAAVIENGTTPRQRRINATVGTLGEAAAQAGIQSPAVSIVGPVCALAEDFDWYSRLPLKCVRIVVTRPKKRIGTMAKRLRDLGAEVVEYPCIEKVAITPPHELEQALNRIDDYEWLAFTSPSGVETLTEHLKAVGKDVRALGRIRLAAIGGATADELEKTGLRADFVPSVYDAAHLGQELAPLAQGRVLMLRAEQGSPELPDALRKAGVSFDDVAIYRTNYENPDAESLRRRFAEGAVDYVTFTSASTVTGFVNSMGSGFDCSDVCGLCIGEQTAKEANRYGISTIVSPRATMDDMVRTIVAESQKHNNHQ